MKSVVVDFPGCDFLEIQILEGKTQFHLICCRSVSDLIKKMRDSDGDNVPLWALPSGNSHAEMLVRELILKSRDEWNYPYEHLELCHCRSVPTEVVDQAILAGAHSPERVRAQTSASSACGTCRPEIEKILSFRLRSCAAG